MDKDKAGRNSLEIAQLLNTLKVIEIFKNHNSNESKFQNINISKKYLSIPFYSLNDHTTSIYPLLCSKLTPQKQQMIDQVFLFF